MLKISILTILVLVLSVFAAVSGQSIESEDNKSLRVALSLWALFVIAVIAYGYGG